MNATNVTKKAMLLTAMLACFSSSVSFASDWDEEPEDRTMTNYTEGHWGMGSGAIAGAAVGGPPGFVVGAIVGKIFGRHQGMENTIQERDDQLGKLRVQINDRDRTIASFQQQEIKTPLRVASLVNVPIPAAPDFEQLIQQGITFTIPFKTGSDRIEDHLMDHCRSLTLLVKSFPKLRVNLTGFADARGEASFNLSLSQRRLQAVKTLLLQQGIAEESIIITAKGEQDLLNLGKDRDSLAFDRRVVITFSQLEEQS